MKTKFKLILCIFSISAASQAWAGPITAGGPPAPQQQIAQAFVNIDGYDRPSKSDLNGCDNGTSEEAKAALALAISRAQKLTCIHGGHPGTVEPGRIGATQTESFGWLCEASATLPCM